MKNHIATALILLQVICAQNMILGQATITPIDRGRFPNGHVLNQSSGLFSEGHNLFITHNDQGNPTMQLFRFTPSTGTNALPVLDTIDINYVNSDWEDLTTNGSDKIYLCETGKNCNANSPPDCAGRYIFKILEIPIASLHAPGLEPITPVVYHFKYPLLGTCTSADTVFANVEAVVYKNQNAYVFTKDIWSKNTNNCGSWDNNFTYCFRIPLMPGSSPSNPIVATYMGSFNLEVVPGEAYVDKKPLAAALDPSGNILAITSGTRLWLFEQFSGDDWFGGQSRYLDYIDGGGNKVSRGYEGLDFIDANHLLLSVDGNNGRVQELDLSGIINSGNVGIGTSLPQSRLHIKEGDVYLDTNQGGMILKNGNGDCFKITVDNGGNLLSTNVPCP